MSTMERACLWFKRIVVALVVVMVLGSRFQSDLNQCASTPIHGFGV